MRRAIERRLEELDDIEDTKCRRRSYALAQRESLPIPLPIPVYPPPKPVPHPPPKTSVYRPGGPGSHRPNIRGYRPSAFTSPLPATPEVPSTPPVRNQHGRCLTTSLAPMPEEPPTATSSPVNATRVLLNKHEGQTISQEPASPETRTNTKAQQGRLRVSSPQTTIPLADVRDTHTMQGHIPSTTNNSHSPTPSIHQTNIKDTNSICQQVPSTTNDLPPSSPSLQLTEIKDTNPTCPQLSFPLNSCSISSNNLSTAPSIDHIDITRVANGICLQDSGTTNSLPPTPPPTHNLPPTPTSLSRSNTPTSLTCPRTPTSIRAAPWQPQTPTSLTHKASSSPTVAVTGSSATSYPPTPPSSPSNAGLDVTPSSSVSSSLDQGLNHSRLSLSSNSQLPEVEDEQEEPPEFTSSGVRPEETVTPAILEVNHLNVNVTKNATSPMDTNSVKELGVSNNSPNHDTNNELPNNGTDDLVKTQDQNNTKVPPPEITYQTYRSRFWILALFSATAFLQSTVWGTFGSIAESAQVAFPNWTDATIAAFPNWGPIIVVVFTIPMMWVTQKLGLRLGMIACVVLITSATMVRCVTSQDTAFTVLCHVGSILNAFAACLTLSLPAMVAATWFPPHERTTATAVGALWCQLGGAAIYMGPLIVRAPTPETNPEDIRSDIMTLMYIHFGSAALLLISVVAYFPAKPPTPPSASSAKEKIDFLAGIKAIMKNYQLLLVIAVYSFSFGVPVVWIGVLSFSLLAIDIHQNEAMGVAVTAVLCSGLAAFITARITDKVYGHLKITIICLLLASSLFFLWFVLLSTKVITSSLAQVYVSVTGGISFEYATVPLLVELAVELGYPIPESVTGATLTFLFNIVALVFLGIFQIPDIGYIWVSYVLLACVSLTVVPLLFVTETHKRFETDLKEPANTSNAIA